MTVQDFTPQEMDTLRRFEAAPNLQEQGHWDSRPLVPSGPIQDAGVLAPAPDSTTGTADQWSQHYLADSLAQQALGRHLMHRSGMFSRQEAWDISDVPQIQEMSQAYHESATSFLLGFLFRHVSDEVAREAVVVMESGDSSEWSWPWLAEAGVDPYLIKTPETRAEREASGRERLAALRAAKQPHDHRQESNRA